MHTLTRPIADYLTAIWQCRYFWLSLVRKDLESRYRRSLLGIGWSLVHPVALTIVVCAVFHSVLEQDVAEYAPFLLAGISTWYFLSACVLGGCGSFTQGEAYIRQHPAPLAIYPLRVTLGATFHLLVSLTVVALLVRVVQGTLLPSAVGAWIPAVLLLVLLGGSLATLAGIAHARFPDTQHLAEVALQVLFYATPVIYPRAMLAEHRLGWLFHYNPLALFLELIRKPLVDGIWPESATWMAATWTTAAVFVLAVGTLAACQRRLVLYL